MAAKGVTVASGGDEEVDGVLVPVWRGDSLLPPGSSRRGL